MLLDTDLPGDRDAPRAVVVGQAAERRILQERIVALVTANKGAYPEIIRLPAIITAFQRHRFGARS
jgi:transposase